MKDGTFRQLQWEHRYEPHVEPINRMADAYAAEGRPMPYVAPVHGGINARMLFILRDPGPGTADSHREGTRWLCIENDDQSAERFSGLLVRAGIRVEDTLPWNAYPWYINAKPSGEQLRAGLEPLNRLLGMLPDLQVVVLMGNSAQTSWDLLVESGKAPRVQVLRTRHHRAKRSSVRRNSVASGTASSRTSWTRLERSFAEPRRCPPSPIRTHSMRCARRSITTGQLVSRCFLPWVSRRTVIR
jgi:uracil-DNA glycosylase